MTISDTEARNPDAPRNEPAVAASVARVRPPRASSSKPNGQWKIDGTAPLNGNEEWKQQGGGLEVRERIESTYAKGGFATRSTRPICTADSAGGVCIRSASPASMAAAPRPSSPPSSRTSTSCCASASTGAS